MNIYNKLIVFASLLYGSLTYAQQTPAQTQTEAIVIEGATAHLGNGTIIENSLIMFEAGTLTFVGDSKMKIARKGKKINATGKHIYPGFIAPTKALGLTEIDAVRASRDEDEIGEYIPHVRSLIAYNTESKVVESMRPNGVLLAQITPQGGDISGTSSIVQLDAWNWEDAAIKVDDGIHLHWPNSFKQGSRRTGDHNTFKPNENYQESIAEILTFIKNSKAYSQTVSKEENAPFKAMQGLFTGSQKLYIYVNKEKEIIDAITLIKNEGIDNIVIVGGYEAYKITDFLKQNNIPVLVQATHNRPQFEDEDYDLPYKLPKLLTDAGILVGIQNASADNFQTRNLPFYAGQVAGQGLDKEMALSLITGNTAKILGIDDKYGTLEVGKSATLFISEGDALDMRTNQLIKAFIDGRDISLETHQTELWKRYMEKYNAE
ncbi:amidohydrolase [Formosa agariphila KMM 3901]|uniref:Amidohydrolase n=1 Tax=Formosa agariphila (strain DSM 15362 / KCTC 12365 / LMG 23005 / KMM 3901 / M-2Alg 35-1) TaxID=1347342 RepID=T2KRH3_FORAG|nr:amidohydrolase family protein [Formosa agariphila]CDF81123.1 amidohydrolase [Formosa agariphila KMM 3901]